jgi:hypothetical protein
MLALDFHMHAAADQAMVQTPPNGAESHYSAPAAYIASDKVYFHAQKREIVPTLGLVHFDVCENGKANYRDGTVLGKNTTLQLSPSFQNQKIRVGLWLNHENALGASGSAPAPKMFAKHLSDANKAMQKKTPLPQNELWINAKDIGTSMQIVFKKRAWALSTWYRKVCQVRWPKFVLTASFTRPDGTEVTEISEEFEVRSKEQRHKTRAARGLSSTKIKRRTPAIEALDSQLRSLQADIVNRRDEIQKLESENQDLNMRFEFICRILASQNAPISNRLENMCHEHRRRMQKWNN